MKAFKSNKEYTIEESQKKFYQDSGFDISDEVGNIVAYGRGKTVPYEDYTAAAKEIERLQRLASELRIENESLKNKQEPPKAAAEEKKEKAAKKEGE